MSWFDAFPRDIATSLFSFLHWKTLGNVLTTSRANFDVMSREIERRLSLIPSLVEDLRVARSKGSEGIDSREELWTDFCFSTGKPGFRVLYDEYYEFLTYARDSWGSLTSSHSMLTDAVIAYQVGEFRFPKYLQQLLVSDRTDFALMAAPVFDRDLTFDNEDVGMLTRHLQNGGRAVDFRALLKNKFVPVSQNESCWIRIHALRNFWKLDKNLPADLFGDLSEITTESPCFAEDFHLINSTKRTNSGPEGFFEFLDLGVQPVFGPTLLKIIDEARFTTGDFATLFTKYGLTFSEGSCQFATPFYKRVAGYIFQYGEWGTKMNEYQQLMEILVKSRVCACKALDSENFRTYQDRFCEVIRPECAAQAFLSLYFKGLERKTPGKVDLKLLERNLDFVLEQCRDSPELKSHIWLAVVENEDMLKNTLSLRKYHLTPQAMKIAALKWPIILKQLEGNLKMEDSSYKEEKALALKEKKLERELELVRSQIRKRKRECKHLST